MTTPPLLRPPGSNQKSSTPRHKLPSLKLQTPMTPVAQAPIMPQQIPSSSTSSISSISLQFNASSISSASTKSLHSFNSRSSNSKPQQLKLNILDSSSSLSTDASTPIKIDPSSLGQPTNQIYEERRSSNSGKTKTDSVNTIIKSSDSSSRLVSPLVSSMNNVSIEDNIKEKGLKSKLLDELNEEEWKELSARDQIETLEVLGEGNGGSVKKCSLKTTNQVFALKTITADPSPEFQKQIVRELNFNKSFQSQYIVKYYGTYFNEADACICICMEYMGGRSIDAVYQSFKSRDGRVGEKALGKISEGVLRGLSYLNQQKIMHRDIKPQNILLDSMGNVKLCDFGVSGEVVNSLATTFTGTSFYMAPERIRNEPYTITCDVWSLGLTLLEGAMGYFPFASSDPKLQMSPIELLLIILEFEPHLEDEPAESIVWSASFKDFLKIALIKDNKKRPSPRQMLEHPWMKGQISKRVRMDKLVQYCWGDV